MFTPKAHKATALFLPLPPALSQALAGGYVLTRSIGEKTAYVVSDGCPNPSEVRRAIDRWQRWKRMALVCRRVLMLAGLVTVGSLATHLFW